MVAGGRRSGPGVRLDIDRVLDRVDEKLDAQSGRLETAIERIAESVFKVRLEVQQEGFKREAIERALGALELQVNATREVAQRIDGSQASAAALGAAEGAAKGAAEGATHAMIPAMTAAARLEPRALIKEIMGTFPAKMLAVAAALATLGSGIENVPKIIKWTGGAVVGAWSYLSKDVK